jgi:hypothetical protein
MDSEDFNIKFFVRQASTIFKYGNLKAKIINCNATLMACLVNVFHHCVQQLCI